MSLPTLARVRNEIDIIMCTASDDMYYNVGPLVKGLVANTVRFPVVSVVAGAWWGGL